MRAATDIGYGLRFARRRVGLVMLLYLAGVLTALLLSAPIETAVREALGSSGFGPDLAVRFDVLLWAEIWPSVRPVLASWLGQLLLLLPVLLVVRAAVAAGLIHAARDGGVRGFWSGLGRYAPGAAVIGLVYTVVSLVLAGGTAVAALVLGAAVGTEAAGFYSVIIGVPFAVLVVWPVVDLLQDYSLIAYVSGQTRWASVSAGISFALRHVSPWFVYASFALVAMACHLLAAWLDGSMAATTGPGIVALFALQQLFFFGRAFVTVAWWGAEVACHERNSWDAAPMLAGDGSAA